MASEWQSRFFGGLVNFVAEKAKAEDASLATYISTENMQPNFGGVTIAATLPNSGNITKFKTNDTLFSNIRTYFKKVWRAKFDGHCSNDVLVFRPNDETTLHSSYLHHLCRWEKFTEFSIRTSKGAKMPRGDKDALAQFEFELPPIKEQRAIARILGALDDKIELNRRTSETLEAMARALFKSWFVDFDGVAAQDRQESELGLIPKGWRVGTLADFAELNPEVWSKHTRPDEIRYVDLSNTKWGRIETITNYAAKEAPSRAQRVLRIGDTIVGTVRPGNGSFALVSEDGLTGSTGFAVLRPNKPEYMEAIYIAATSRENIEALAHLADGGAYPAIRPEAVAATQIIVATDDMLAKFSAIARPIFAKIAESENESHTLAQLRDTLLPKLLSGELRVK